MQIWGWNNIGIKLQLRADWKEPSCWDKAYTVIYWRQVEFDKPCKCRILYDVDMPTNYICIIHHLFWNWTCIQNHPNTSKQKLDTLWGNCSAQAREEDLLSIQPQSRLSGKTNYQCLSRKNNALGSNNLDEQDLKQKIFNDSGSFKWDSTKLIWYFVYI